MTDTSATLIDNIFTNVNSETKSAIISTDISYHYPTAAICEKLRPFKADFQSTATYRRDTSACKVFNMKRELNTIDWQDVLGDNHAQWPVLWPSG